MNPIHTPDPDDAPELTESFFAEADIYEAEKLIRPSDNPQRLVSLRLDPDVLEALRATGPGWQTRVNDLLRASLLHAATSNSKPT